MKHYPARHYLLVIWNHGSGWDDSNLYANHGDYFSGDPPPIARKGVVMNAEGSVASAQAPRKARPVRTQSRRRIKVAPADQHAAAIIFAVKTNAHEAFKPVIEDYQIATAAGLASASQECGNVFASSAGNLRSLPALRELPCAPFCP